LVCAARRHSERLATFHRITLPDGDASSACRAAAVSTAGAAARSRTGHFAKDVLRSASSRSTGPVEGYGRLSATRTGNVTSLLRGHLHLSRSLAFPVPHHRPQPTQLKQQMIAMTHIEPAIHDLSVDKRKQNRCVTFTSLNLFSSLLIRPSVLDSSVVQHAVLPVSSDLLGSIGVIRYPLRVVGSPVDSCWQRHARVRSPSTTALEHALLEGTVAKTRLPDHPRQSRPPPVIARALKRTNYHPHISLCLQDPITYRGAGSFSEGSLTERVPACLLRLFVPSVFE